MKKNQVILTLFIVTVAISAIFLTLNGIPKPLAVFLPSEYNPYAQVSITSVQQTSTGHSINGLAILNPAYRDPSRGISNEDINLAIAYTAVYVDEKVVGVCGPFAVDNRKINSPTISCSASITGLTSGVHTTRFEIKSTPFMSDGQYTTPINIQHTDCSGVAKTFNLRSPDAYLLAGYDASKETPCPDLTVSGSDFFKKYWTQENPGSKFSSETLQFTSTASGYQPPGAPVLPPTGVPITKVTLWDKILLWIKQILRVS